MPDRANFQLDKRAPILEKSDQWNFIFMLSTLSLEGPDSLKSGSPTVQVWSGTEAAKATESIYKYRGLSSKLLYATEKLLLTRVRFQLVLAKLQNYIQAKLRVSATYTPLQTK